MNCWRIGFVSGADGNGVGEQIGGESVDICGRSGMIGVIGGRSNTDDKLVERGAMVKVNSESEQGCGKSDETNIAVLISKGMMELLFW
jgi:hypothetical protein